MAKWKVDDRVIRSSNGKRGTITELNQAVLNDVYPLADGGSIGLGSKTAI